MREPAADVGRVVQRAVGVDAGDPAGDRLRGLLGVVRRAQARRGSRRSRPRSMPASAAFATRWRRHGPGDDARVRGGDRAGGERRRRWRAAARAAGRWRRSRWPRRAPGGSCRAATPSSRPRRRAGRPPAGRPHARREVSAAAIRLAAVDHSATRSSKRGVGELGEVDLGQPVEGGAQFGHAPPPWPVLFDRRTCPAAGPTETAPEAAGSAVPMPRPAGRGRPSPAEGRPRRHRQPARGAGMYVRRMTDPVRAVRRVGS